MSETATIERPAGHGRPPEPGDTPGAAGSAGRTQPPRPSLRVGPVGGIVSDDTAGGPLEIRGPSALDALGGPAADSLNTFLESDVLAGFQPGPAPAGFSVPQFGPETIQGVRLAPPAPPAEEAKAGGKRKAAKAFKVPGVRSAPQARPRTEDTSVTIPHMDGRTAVAYIKGRTITDGHLDPAAEMAAELLSAGVLQESDWHGGLDRTIKHGLGRWANEEMGCGELRMLGRLELVYTDDALGYSNGARFDDWRAHFHARRDKPVGFFGLRWQGAPRPVHVRAMVKRLNEIWPDYGYSLMNLLNNAFVSSVNSHSFLWGEQFIQAGEAKRAAQFREWEARDQYPTGFGDVMSFDTVFPSVLSDNLTEAGWRRAVPKEAALTDFRIDAARRAAEQAPRTAPDLAAITAQSMALWDACRAAGTTFYLLNHHPFMTWEMTQKDLRTGKQVAMPIGHLYRAPCVFTVWDPANDPMGRLTDDHSEVCRQSMTYSDLTWLHGFQLGFSGIEPPASREAFLAQQRAVAKAMKRAPETVNLWDADYQHKPLPDGSLAHAVTALRLVLTIVKALDALLWMLHQPEMLAEMERAGKL